MKTTGTTRQPNPKMTARKINILLADDDTSDRLLFKEALDELPLSTVLTTVTNGEQLIEHLINSRQNMPDVLFLDLHMPRKNGFESLGLIKRSTELENLPVIIFSTDSDRVSLKKIYRDAAHYFICKPVDFSQLKKVIYEALLLISQEDIPLPTQKDFTITGDAIVIPEKK